MIVDVICWPCFNMWLMVMQHFSFGAFVVWLEISHWLEMAYDALWWKFLFNAPFILAAAFACSLISTATFVGSLIPITVIHRFTVRLVLVDNCLLIKQQCTTCVHTCSFITVIHCREIYIYILFFVVYIYYRSITRQAALPVMVTIDQWFIRVDQHNLMLVDAGCCWISAKQSSTTTSTIATPIKSDVE